MRSFSLAESIRFGALSGDVNPLHIDPVAARRTIYGEPVVHGMHLVLWVLDAVAGRIGRRAFVLDRLDADFRHPTLLGHDIELDIENPSPDIWKVGICHDGRTLTTLKFGLSTRLPVPLALPPSQAVKPYRERGFAELNGDSGELPLFIDAAALSESFPDLASRMEACQIANLLALTRLVGMECPGLHSAFSKVTCKFSEPRAIEPLVFDVTAADERFRFIDADTRGPGMEATIRAFFRAPPVAQISMRGARGLVSRGAFRGRRALVVGGSRGLGEATAKLFAAGDGRVWISYTAGEADAARVVDEIRAAGGDASAFALNVLHPPAPDELARYFADAGMPDTLFYFASPKIDTTAGKPLSRSLLDTFLAFYDTGFRRLVETLHGLAREPLVVFFPSSVFIDDNPGMAVEYSMAKLAGEAACRDLQHRLKGCRVVAVRLPRVGTDQTIGVHAPELRSAGEVMAEVISAAPFARPEPVTRSSTRD